MVSDSTAFWKSGCTLSKGEAPELFRRKDGVNALVDPITEGLISGILGELVPPSVGYVTGI